MTIEFPGFERLRPVASATRSPMMDTEGALSFDPIPEGTSDEVVLERAADAARASYGEDTYFRLASVKRKYDPTNVFQRNQNIEPQSAGS